MMIGITALNNLIAVTKELDSYPFINYKVGEMDGETIVLHLEAHEKCASMFINDRDIIDINYERNGMQIVYHTCIDVNDLRLLKNMAKWMVTKDNDAA